MSIFDKIKNVNLDEIAKGTKGILGDIGQKATESFSGATNGIKKYREDSKDLSAPLEGAIKRYGFTYQGGLSQYIKKKSGEVGLNIMEDSFYLKPTRTTQEWFEEMAIPYTDVKKIEVVKRTVSTAEYMLSSNGDAKSLEQDNTVEITFMDENAVEQILRLEMLTGFTVFKQAKICKEFMDVLRQNRIFDKFMKNKEEKPLSAGDDILGKIEKMSELKKAGILTEEEFAVKKSELLSQL